MLVISEAFAGWLHRRQDDRRWPKRTGPHIVWHHRGDILLILLTAIIVVCLAVRCRHYEARALGISVNGGFVCPDSGGCLDNASCPPTSCHSAGSLRPHLLSVCLCFSRLVTSKSPAKTDEPINIPFGLWTRVGPKSHVFGLGPIPRRRRNSGGIFQAIVKYGPIWNIRHEPKLFARWQQRCSLSLSVLQQLVVNAPDRPV